MYKYIFLCKKQALKHHNSLQIKIKEKPSTLFCSQTSTRSYDKKFENLAISLNSLKTDLETNFLSLENQRFEYVIFSQ